MDNRSLFCAVRNCICALPIQSVEETMRPLPVEPLAEAPSFVCGLSLIRGIPTPVVDAGALTGLAGDPAFARFVTLRVGGRAVALAVEGVLGIRDLPALESLPPLLQQSGEAVSAVGVLDAELLLLLNSAHLVPESMWQALERSKA